MRPHRLLWYALNVGFGLGVSLLGVYYTLQSIVDDGGGALFDAPCRENAFFFGSAPADAYSCSNETVFYSQALSSGVIADG